MAASIVLPWSHRAFSLLKRWALGTYHGLRRKHVDAYLDEFVFRYNRRFHRHVSFETIPPRSGECRTAGCCASRECLWHNAERSFFVGSLGPICESPRNKPAITTTRLSRNSSLSGIPDFQEVTSAYQNGRFARH